jgi:membrane protein implicated in regulation of membrane protease activity
MSRILVATLLGLGFFFFYVVAVLALADLLGAMQWVVQFCFFAVSGVLWVFPIRWLMLWAAGRRKGSNHRNPA